MEYKELYLPNHHRAKTNGCVDEHIIIAERKLGRELKKGEVVHHKDENKRNNDPENLMVFTSNSAHIAFHRGGKLIELSDGTYDCEKLPVRYCEMCGKMLMTKRSKMCPKCDHIKKRKCVWPTREELEKDVIELKSNLAISKKYGVSDKTVAKWKARILFAPVVYK